ncbi:MAG TPA: hypothetical protein VHL11_18550 [Phototrophicaceae bacterium]|nr:hypothetical protein [Phototrophicaceae bacterium]
MALRFLRLMVLVMLAVGTALLMTACTRGDVSDVQRDPAGGIDATVTLSESDINSDITTVLAERPNPLLRNPQVDLQPGKIVINGEHDKRDGSGTVNGSITVGVSIMDGKIQASITEINIEGLDLSDERIAAFNERLSAIFARRAERDRGILNVKSVTITDDNFEIVVNIQRQ